MQRWLATSLIIIVGLMALILADQYLRTQVAVHNSELLDTRLRVTGASLEKAIQQNISILEDIAALILINPQLPDYRQFSELATSLRVKDSAIQGIGYVNPDGSTKYYFPGSDELSHAEIDSVLKITSASLLKKSRSLHRTVTANPAMDADGRQLMTILIPLFRGSEFSGYIRGILNLVVLIDAVMEADHQGISFQIRDAEGRQFYGTALSNDDIRTDEVTIENSQWVLSGGWQGAAPLPDVTVRSMLWILGILLILTGVAYINRRFDYDHGLSLVITNRLRALREETRKLGQNLNGHLNAVKNGENSQQKNLIHDKNIPVGLFNTDASGHLTYVNTRWCEISGIAVDVAMGQKWFLAVAKGEQEPIRNNWLQAVESLVTYSSDIRFTHPDGTVRWALVQAVPIADEQGRVDEFIGTCTDITKQKESAEKIRSSERELQTILEGMQDTYFRTDAQGCIVRVSKSATKLLGYRFDEMVGIPVYRHFQHAKDRKKIINLLKQKGATISDHELQLRKNDGSSIWVSLNAQHCRQEGDNDSTGIEGTVRDINSRKKIESQIQKLSKSFEHAAEAAVIATPESIIEYVNPAFEKMTGYRREEIIGRKSNITESDKPAEGTHKKILRAILDGKTYQGILVNFRKDGSLFYEDRTITSLRDEQGKITHIVATGKDVTTRIHRKQRTTSVAHHDALTELPSHEEFMELLEKSLARARAHSRFVAVMRIDMGSLRDANIDYEHDVGNQVMQVYAKRIRDAVRDVDVVARLDNNAFTVLLDDVSNVNHVSIIARKIVEAITPSVLMDRNKVRLAASIGISIFPEDGENAKILLKNSGSAMHRARKLGKNNYQFYSADMSARRLARLKMKNGLRYALERNEFLLHYQPQLNIQTNHIVGAEALLRWQHPELGLLSPGNFVPLLEESGLIESVGEWVLEKSFSQACIWHDAGFSSLRITVNLSNRQFNDPGFITTIENIIKRTGIDPHLLELELTESVIMRNTRSANTALDSLDKMGVKFSIDDFGTGYSSLYYLKRFPVDTLKIDRSFVSDVTTNPDDAAIVSAIISMGHNMKLKVIAEGVENNEQMDFLRAHDCDIIQGFLFSQPLLPAGMSRVLREKSLH